LSLARDGVYSLLRFVGKFALIWYLPLWFHAVRAAAVAAAARPQLPLPRRQDAARRNILHRPHPGTR
jgi:hypothetical protein